LLLLLLLLLPLLLLLHLQLVQSIPQIFHLLPHLIVLIDEGSECGSISRVVAVVVVSGNGAKITIGAASAAGAPIIVLRHFAFIAFIACIALIAICSSYPFWSHMFVVPGHFVL
jgi:hypothetical protein